jgi:N-methylhydantoinase A/oxoprolinase/acetone carboxylase beta subunit
MAWRVGVDIGGTFTDVALIDEASGEIGVAKVPTTPRDLAESPYRLSALPGRTTPRDRSRAPPAQNIKIPIT